MGRIMNAFILFFLGVLLSVSAQSQSAELGAYTLGSGDTIRISVYGEEDLSLEAQLGDSGILNYPFLGELRLSGLSVANVEQKITQGLLGDYLIEPKVSVSVMQYRQFFVNGEVSNPGGFAFQPGLTVGKALSLAGGFTERANKKDIYILSDSSAGEAPKKAKLSSAVKPGDIITIKQSFF